MVEEIILIAKALALAGYDLPVTKSSLIECARDYIDCGVFHDMDVETFNHMVKDGDLTVRQIAIAMISYCRG